MEFVIAHLDPPSWSPAPSRRDHHDHGPRRHPVEASPAS